MEENHVKHHGACGGDDGDVGGHSGYRDGGGEGAASVSKLGDLWTALVTNLLTKIAQVFGDFCGYLEKLHYLNKNCCVYFWPTSGKIWATFYLHIWSQRVAQTVILRGKRTESSSYKIKAREYQQRPCGRLIGSGGEVGR